MTFGSSDELPGSRGKEKKFLAVLLIPQKAKNTGFRLGGSTDRTSNSVPPSDRLGVVVTVIRSYSSAGPISATSMLSKVPPVLWQHSNAPAPPPGPGPQISGVK